MLDATHCGGRDPGICMATFNTILMLTEKESHIIAKELELLIQDESIKGKAKVVLKVVLAEITNDSFNKERYLSSLNWLNAVRQRKLDKDKPKEQTE